MAYDLHITRAEKTWNSKENPISEGEWLLVVENDSSMERIERLEGKNPQTGRLISVPMLNSATWDYQGYKVPFHYSRGKISVSNPDEGVIKKMKEIALKLNARVLGDEEEEY